MTQKSLIQLSKSKINKGKNKQQAFEEVLHESAEEALKIANIIRYIPTLPKRRKFKQFNQTLASLMVVYLLVVITAAITPLESFNWRFYAITLPWTAVYSVIIAGVYQFRGNFYNLSFSMTLFGLPVFIGNELNNGFDFSLYVALALMALILIIGGFLHYRLFPAFEVRKVLVRLPDGSNGLEKRVFFY